MTFWDWPADTTVEATKDVARKMLEDVRSGAAKIWTVTHGDQFVGVVDLSDIDGREADLGFMIRRALWGQGYASQAARLVIAKGWATGLVRLRARIHAGNLRSRRLLERLGFGLLEERDVEIRPGETTRCAFFALERKRQGSSSLSQ